MRLFTFIYVSILLGCRTVTEDSAQEIQVRPDDEPSVEPEPDDTLRDIDQDGYLEDVDCDDWNPNVYPGAIETLNNVDDDCDGFIDGDGRYAGVLSLEAMAIYQGQPYGFVQACDATVERSVGQVEMMVICQIDTMQERAEQLLGGVLSVISEEIFIFDNLGSGIAYFQSTEGEIEWDAQGDVSWIWSSWAENQSRDLEVIVELDALHLDIRMTGMLVRE